MRQLSIPFEQNTEQKTDLTGRERIRWILSQDLDFHSLGSEKDSHVLHSFPAKFPPQLPARFIEELTEPGDTVLDPMMGSGTTVLEAYLADRRAVGFDIDPLAILISRVKVTPLDKLGVARVGNSIIERAVKEVRENSDQLKRKTRKQWDGKSRDFIDYWFVEETQLELAALVSEIEKVEDAKLRAFLNLALSATIITKSGGVSLSRDLAHTRPHRVKVLLSKDGEVLFGKAFSEDASNHRLRHQMKILRSPFEEFEKSFKRNLKYLEPAGSGAFKPYIHYGNAQNLPLESESIDLIVTSPPYASNAIDYMRAHKFSLVWMGYPVEKLGNKRKKYIGGEMLKGFEFLNLPKFTEKIVKRISEKDAKKGQVLHRYYSEMTRTIREMFRVLKFGKTAVVVVGSSTLRGVDVQTHNCLADIGSGLGFDCVEIGERSLDRNRRMMPAGADIDMDSQIQKRMHKEYVICFTKS